MFAGIIEELGRLVELRPAPPGQRLVIEGQQVSQQTQIGDSIAVNGCCLTVVQRDGSRLEFDVGPESLQRTNLGQLSPGSRVNLERSLVVGDRLGGHFVTGHVDAVGFVDQRIDENDWSTIWYRVPPQLTRQMASKGSVAVDGVSLTLVEVERDRFSVALIPHTLQVTTLGYKGPGDPVNLETDLLAKYVEQQLQGEQSS
jgi:riboflavin synthase